MDALEYILIALGIVFAIFTVVTTGMTILAIP